MDASALSISAMNNFQTMAGVPGFEPGLSVLETDVLTVDTIPLRRRTRGLGETAPRRKSPCLRVAPSPCRFSLGFLMISVLAATATELTKLQPIGRSFLILSRNVVAAFAFVTLKDNVIAWHNSNPDSTFNRTYRSYKSYMSYSIYSITSETVPAPTVRPPSRIANRSPFSIAIGAINSISIATLSPGITISTPAGNAATPVTSVVRK